MSQKTKAQLIADVNANFPDNTNGEISPLDLRTQSIDDIDSTLNLQETLLQTIIGLVNFTGGLQVDGVGVVLPKINFISQESDFPTQDGSSITLEALQWYIVTGAGFSTAKHFIVKDRAVLSSQSTIGPLITYTGTGSMFEIDDASFTIRLIQLTHPNAQGYNFTTSVGGTFEFLSDNVRHISGTKYGTFEDPAILLIQVGAAFDVDDGISVSGTNISIFSIDKMGMFSTSNTFKAIDLGSSQAQTTEFRDFNANAPAGAFGISGLSSSGNIPTGRLAMINNCEFGGGMTSLENITNEDVRFRFRDNTPIPDTIEDAMVSLNGNTTETVISTINTPVLTVGTWTCERESLFDCTTGGRVTLTSERDTVLPVDIAATIVAASGTNKDITVYLALNGSIIANSAKSNRVGSTDPRNTSVLWQLNLSTGDFLEVFVENNSDTINLVVTDAILRVR